MASVTPPARALEAMSWKTVVVGYAGDQASERALGRAAEIARSGGASLIVTSIVRPLASGAAARGIGP
ncbi:MAG: universal stress protein, partial [Gaiellaceae bacterium]